MIRNSYPVQTPNYNQSITEQKPNVKILIHIGSNGPLILMSLKNFVKLFLTKEAIMAEISKKKNRRKKTVRGCLRCGKNFMSEGNFNRICGPCRVINGNIANNTVSVQGLP